MSDRSLLVVALLLGAGRAAAEPPKLTLPDLIRIAREHSVAAKIPLADREVRRAQRNEAWLAYAPSLETNWYLTGAPSIQCRAPLADYTPQAQALAIEQGISLQDLRQRDCIGTQDPNNGQTINFLNFNISGVGAQFDFHFTQPLYTFGKIESGVKAAEHGMAAADAQAEAARREVELQVTQAYWGLKAARAARDTLNEVRDKISEWEKKISDDLEEAKPKFTTYDLKRIQLGIVDVDSGIIEAENKIQTALYGLQLLCGEAVDVDDAELDAVEIADRPLDYYVGEMAHNRPESRALDEGVQAYRWLARVQRAYLLPDLAIAGSVSWRGTTASVEDSQSAYQSHVSYFGFGAVLVLRHSFDFVRLARIRHADADTEQMMAQREGGRALFSIEIARAYNDVVEARKKLALYEKGQKQARGWLSAIDQDLDATPYLMIEAARSYFYQRLNYFNGIYTLNYNIARLRRASGVEVAK